MIPSLSVLVPVYNSEQSLRPLVERLYPVLVENASVFELVLINDGSRDDSWNVVKQLADEHGWIVGINLMRNFGQHNALLCGIRAAQHQVIVTMDDDLQHPPEELPKMLDKLGEGYDVVYGRPERQRQGIWRDFASWIIKLSLRAAMGIESASDVSPFRAFNTSLRQAFADYRSPYVIIDVLLTWGTSRFAAVPVRHDRRTLGSSNYSFSKLLAHATNMTTGFSALPLRLASFIGFTFSLLGLGVLLVVLLRYLLGGGSPAGFAFLASTIAIFSGAQLLALGIIGEYLGRLHFRSMERPPYVVHEIEGARSRQLESV